MTESTDEAAGRLRHHKCELSLSFGASPTHLPAVVNVVKVICEFMSIEETEEYEITLAVNEAVANSIEHAFENNPEKEVGVRVSVHDGTFSCSIAEDNPLTSDAVLKSTSVEEFGKSDGEKGVGLTLMDLYMDNVERVRTERGFEWLLTRRLRGHAMAESRDK